MKITQITRKDLFDAMGIEKVNWAGTLEESEFLSGASGFSVGNGVKIETTKMKKNHDSQPCLVPETASRIP